MGSGNLITSSKGAITEWKKVKSGVAGDTIFSAKLLIYIAILIEKLVKKPTKIINITIFGKNNK
jgi:uncharacterized membrane protein